jgi:hypothetical protein
MNVTTGWYCGIVGALCIVNGGRKLFVRWKANKSQPT